MESGGRGSARFSGIVAHRDDATSGFKLFILAVNPLLRTAGFILPENEGKTV
jgi:hypothetical protein